MKASSNKTPLNLNLVIMHVVGIWPSAEKYTKLYGVYSILTITLLPTLHNLSQVINCFFIYDNIELLAQVLYIVVVDLVSVVKVVIIVKNMSWMKTIVNGVDAQVFQPKTEHQREILAKIMSSWKRVFYGFVTSACCTLVLWTVTPILDKSYKEGNLPFLAWYPYNFRISPYYEFTYAYQMISTYVICFINLAVDGLMAAIMTFVGGQCALLCDDLRNLYEFTKKKLEEQKLLAINHPDNEIQVLNELNISLINCMKFHKDILSYADNARGLIDIIAAYQFVVSAIVICMTTFQLTLVKPLSAEFFSYLSFEAGISLQLLQYCWFGNEALLYSSEIPYAIFESSWIEAPIEVKKNIVLFIFRTQKPIVFKALNFFDLSLRTFLSILKLSWSYFGLLRQLNSDRNA